MFRRVPRFRLLDLLPVLVTCLVVFALFLVMRDHVQHSGLYGRFLNNESGPEVCLESAHHPREWQPPHLQLADCSKASLSLSSSQQYFQLTPRWGYLRSWDGLCVDGALRLGPCDADDLEWIFTQGAGLVHVGSGLCMTREAGDGLSMDTCRTQPPQYWWFRKSAQSNVL